MWLQLGATFPDPPPWGGIHLGVNSWPGGGGGSGIRGYLISWRTSLVVFIYIQRMERETTLERLKQLDRQIKRCVLRQSGRKADRQTRVRLEDRMWKEAQRQTDGQNLPQPVAHALLHWVLSHYHPPSSRPMVCEVTSVQRGSCRFPGQRRCWLPALHTWSQGPFFSRKFS